IYRVAQSAGEGSVLRHAIVISVELAVCNRGAAVKRECARRRDSVQAAVDSRRKECKWPSEARQRELGRVLFGNDTRPFRARSVVAKELDDPRVSVARYGHGQDDAVAVRSGYGKHSESVCLDG